MSEKIGFGATYFSPLSDEQFAALGKITATLGQIERNIDFLIAYLSDVSDVGVLEILLNGKMFLAKAELLKKLAKLKAGPGKYRLVADACEALANLAAARNHAIHGSWGDLATELKGTSEGKLDTGAIPTRVAAYSSKRSDQPLLASQLPALVEQAENAARLLYTASAAIIPGLDGKALPLRSKFTAHAPLSSRSK